MMHNLPNSKIKHPLMRYHGGKFRLADWILTHFPPHTKYVEPFGGAASVLMRKPRSYAEVYNDLDSSIVNVFRVIRNPECCETLIERLINTPYSREEFELAYQPSEDPIEAARRVLIRAQSGFGSSGATKGTTGWRSDSDRLYGLASHLWAKYPASLGQFCERLSGVIIENRPALDVLLMHDTPETLHFVDPPYMWDTRYTENGRIKGQAYAHELTTDDHIKLLEVLVELKGMVIVCGYMNDLYSSTLGKQGWQLKTKESRIAAFRGTKVKTECIWINPKCDRKQPQVDWLTESKVCS